MSWQLTNHWVAPRLTGGLGNRLFQTVAALGVAERTGRQPVWLLPRISAATEHGEIGVERELCPRIPVLDSAASWKESAHDCIEEGVKGDGLVMRGYFQRIDDVWPSLENLWLPKIPINGCELINYNSVAIHFRFGDYCKLPHHQIDLRGYYKHAISLFAPDTVFVLFSDSPHRLYQIAEELVKEGKQVVIKETKSAVETWQAMSCCGRGMICSNSTFAWWGAYFSWCRLKNSKDYCAYMPNRWLQGDWQPKLWDSKKLPFAHGLSVDGYATGLHSFSYS